MRQVEEALKDHETPKLVKRLISSSVVLVVLIYITMGHNMWGFPVPDFFSHNHIGLAKDALEKLEGVDAAKVSHESGTAVLSVNDKFLAEQVETEVRDAGYEFIGIQ